MDLGMISRWDTGALADLQTALSRRATTVTEARNTLRDVGRLPAWVGESASRARADFAATADGLDDEIATIGAVREIARQTEVAVADLKRQLAALEAEADANRMTIADSGAVSFNPAGMDDAEATSMEAVRADIEARAHALIRQAADVDSDAADVLRRAAAGEIDARGAHGDAALDTGRLQGSLTTDPPPAGASPAEVNRYWNALAPEQKGYILSEHPDWVGNRDGVPAAVRDDANRRQIGTERTRLEERRDKLRRDIDNHPFGGTFTNEDAELWFTEQKLQDLDAVQQTLATRPDTRLLLFDMQSGERGHAAIAVGDPDTADHISVTTPGLGTTVNGAIDGMTGEATNLKQQSEAILEAQERDGETVASIAWIGYDAPNFDGPAGLGQWAIGGEQVASSSVAEQAGPRLGSFYQGLAAASTHPDPHITALGHSYGSLTTSIGVQDANGAVDDAVFYGSPGLGAGADGTGVRDATDLNLIPGHAYLLEADDDIVADSGNFRGDPSASDLTKLSTAAGVDPTGVVRSESAGHAGYPRATDDILNMAGYNMAAVVSGSPTMTVPQR